MGNQRQHVIPRFYLNRFIGPGWVYRRGAPKPRFVKKTKNVAVRIDYYGCPKDEHKALDEINKVTESEGAPVLEKLISNTTAITRSDWIILSYLFANFAVRTPVIINTMRDTLLSLIQQVNEMAQEMTKSYKKAKEKGKDLSLFPKPDLGDSQSYSLDEINRCASELEASNGHLAMATSLFGAMKAVANCIQQMSYLILKAPAGLFFVTCDRPLTLYSLSTGSLIGAGWGNTDALATIPLSPKHLLMMFYYTPDAIYKNQIMAKDVHLQNIDTMKFAADEVYSPKEYKEAEDWMCQTGQWARTR